MRESALGRNACVMKIMTKGSFLKGSTEERRKDIRMPYGAGVCTVGRRRRMCLASIKHHIQLFFESVENAFDVCSVLLCGWMDRIRKKGCVSFVVIRWHKLSLMMSTATMNLNEPRQTFLALMNLLILKGNFFCSLLRMCRQTYPLTIHYQKLICSRHVKLLS